MKEIWWWSWTSEFNNNEVRESEIMCSCVNS